MQKITVIICFSYIKNEKYIFDPKFLRPDLRRLLIFTHNQTQCPLENIYILTDLSPNEKIINEIRTDIYDYVNRYCAKIGYIGDIPKCRDNIMTWIRFISERVSYFLKINSQDLYTKILHNILPIIRSSNVVEFASLFTNFIPIVGVNHFDETLKMIFDLPMKYLFFYYTGHGVKYLTRSWEYEYRLIIPNQNEVQFYSRKILQRRFEKIFSIAHSFIVFDCCHAESFVDLPYQQSFLSDGIKMLRMPTEVTGVPDIIYFGSTHQNQTCGFFEISNDRGSLFTYYLLQFLKNLNKEKSRNFIHLSKNVEEKIQKYRSLLDKPQQNLFIRINKLDITDLPSWLFPSNCSGVRCELIEEP